MEKFLSLVSIPDFDPNMRSRISQMLIILIELQKVCMSLDLFLKLLL